MPRKGYASITVTDSIYQIIEKISEENEMSISKTIEMMMKIYVYIKINPNIDHSKIIKKVKKWKIEKIMNMYHIRK